MDFNNSINRLSTLSNRVGDGYMTDQLRMELEDRLEKAEASGDQTQINEARRAIDHATLECQAHTADRVKRIERDVSYIKATVDNINTRHEEFEKKHKFVASQVYATKDELKEIKLKAAGAKAGISGFIEVLKWVVAMGGGGLLIRFLQNVNI